MARSSRNHTNRGVVIRKSTRLAIYLRDRFTCCYCGTDLHSAKPFQITLDHLVPQSKGGSNDPANMITSCRKCNCSRQDRPWTEFATGGAIQRIQNARRRTLPREMALAILAGEKPWPGEAAA